MDNYNLEDKLCIYLYMVILPNYIDSYTSRYVFNLNIILCIYL